MRPGLTYQGVLLTVPETTEPTVIEQTCAFSIDSFKALKPSKQMKLVNQYSILEPLLVKSKHMVHLDYYCKTCGVEVSGPHYWSHLRGKKETKCQEAWKDLLGRVPKNLRDANGNTSLFERRI